MPIAPPRACIHCGRPGCTAHVRAGLPPRMRGHALQRARRALFDQRPLCAMCEAVGRVTVATERDHVVPLAAGGLDVDSNCQGLCAACHLRKSQAEAPRGFARAKTR